VSAENIAFVAGQSAFFGNDCFMEVANQLSATDGRLITIIMQ
jgi:hypothetical protein